MRVIILLLFFPGATWLSGASLQQNTGVVIQGKVTDRTGAALAGAAVTIIGTSIGVQTASDGTYLISDLKKGTLSVRYSYVGYETQTRTVNLIDTTTLDIVLEVKTLMTDDVIIKATRAGDNTPMAFINVSGEAIRKQNSAQDIPFLLSLTPSLIETSEAGNGVGYTSLRIRGTDASRINVTIDGIPLNDSESQQVFWVDLPDLASSVDNIQVQRGVGTSSNGPGAFGASINIQTKGIESEPFAEINTSAGSFSTFKNNISAGTGLLHDRFAFQMRFSDLRSNGFIERTGSEHRSAFLSGIYRTDRSVLKTNIILGQEHTGIGWWGVPSEMLKINRRFNPAGQYTDENGITRFYGNESDNYIQNHFQLIYTRKLNDLLSLHSAFHYTKGKGYYEEYKDDRLLSDYGLPDIITGGLTITETDLIQRKWLSNDFYGMIYSLNFKSNKLEANFGGGANLYSGDHFGRIIWMKNPGNIHPDHQWYLNNGKKGEVSLYGKAVYSVSRRLNFFGDVQYRFINYEMIGPDDDFKDLGQSHRYSFFNPKAGLFVLPNRNSEAYISLSIANREPSRADFKEAAGDKEAMPRPERLYDLEAGYKLRFGNNSVAINLYGMFYKDQLVPTGELSNVGYPIMTNVEKSYRTGAEFVALFVPASFLDWNFSVTLSRNKIENFTEYYTDYNTSDGSTVYKNKMLGMVDIAYSPSVTGTSDLTFKPAHSFDIHFISKYVGKQYFDNTMNTERMLKPYFFSNLRLDFEPLTRKIKGLQLQMLINNIFNSEYESNAYGGNWFEDGVEKSWAYYFPQAGINYMIKLALRF